MSSNKIVFLVNVLSQARCVRRIQDFISNGYEVKVYGYDRKEGRRAQLSYEFVRLGVISSEISYAKRLIKMRADVKHVIATEGNENIFYLFNYDIALAFLSIHPTARYIYEVSDLMELMVGNKVLKNILVAINRWMLGRSLLNVMTSEGFVDFYYPQKKGRNKCIVLPNKVNKKCLALPYPDEKVFDPNNIKFSFTGAIRSEALYQFIKNIGELGIHEMHLYGVYTDDKKFADKIRNLVKTYTNIVYHGPFKNPEDFPNIYSQIDIVVSLYTASDNDKYLESNKLYEAIYYQKPIIVAASTFLGKKVNKLNIGYAIDLSSPRSILESIKSIGTTDYAEKVKNLKLLPRDYAIDNPYELFNKLNHLL